MTDSYHAKQQAEFASKLLALQVEAMQRLSPLGWFLLTSAVCRMGEPSVTVFPKLSHSHSAIDGLGDTYRESLAGLSEAERSTIQELYRRFTDSLSYGRPTMTDLRD